MEAKNNPKTMRNLLRKITLACTASLGVAAMAQGYIVTIYGSVTPCNPAMIGDTVLVQSLPGTEPQQTLVAYVTDSCYFGVDAVVTSLTGGFAITGRCGNGMMTSDSGFYSLTPPQPGLIQLNLQCGGGPTDCLGVPGGTALPGTPCTTFLGQPGTWSVDCACIANTAQCDACFTVAQTGANPDGTGGTPWSISTFNCSSGPAPISYTWGLPDSSSSTDAAPTYIFNAPGVYGICLTIATAGCTSTQCDTLIVDSMGFISNAPAWYDCEGVLWGPNIPGAPCNDGDSTTTGDTWTVGCNCEGQGSGTTDCLGVLNGNALPGTACTVPGTMIAGTWSTSCVCVPDSNALNCEAGFWAIQAYDSTSGGIQPIPNEVWVWNLSSGGNGTYQFFWDFGDGTTSTDAFPTHTYSGPGPWLLCLTMTSGDPATGQCTDTYCDSLSVDANGILNGMITGGHVGADYSRDGGFTLNVIQGIPSGIAENAGYQGLQLWPNPVEEVLNITFTTAASGTAPMEVMDPSGRVLLGGNVRVAAGQNTIHLPMDKLGAGLYMVRIGNGSSSVAQRFLKVR